MTISELIRRLENIKFRNPNASVFIVEANPEIGGVSSSPIRFGEMRTGMVTDVNIDPLANDMKPLETLFLYGSMAAEKI